ncbi:uncharacterized protein LOC122507583 [Leptopilina heterotoma]|uniref:uncharacterized protein LOC122507583 n=1 Tax=Leptopilina heterotoma TaxID=63436 RepID=UPI001CA80DE5|nr:uncharacterized protein LOC122507583 [Leptopilina heterotoma]
MHMTKKDLIHRAFNWYTAEKKVSKKSDEELKAIAFAWIASVTKERKKTRNVVTTTLSPRDKILKDNRLRQISRELFNQLDTNNFTKNKPHKKSIKPQEDNYLTLKLNKDANEMDSFKDSFVSFTSDKSKFQNLLVRNKKN